MIWSFPRKTSGLTIEDVPLRRRDILVLLVLAGGLGVIVYGVINYGWGVLDIAAVFLGMGILGGIVGGTTPNGMARDFIAGAKDIAMGALIVGIARGILVVMTEGQILDTIVYGLATVISGLPKAVAAEGMLLVQCVINFFIPSGSGQASTTMPIMTPLADIIGLTRQTAVLAFQFGDGFTNAIIPTPRHAVRIPGCGGHPLQQVVQVRPAGGGRGACHLRHVHAHCHADQLRTFLMRKFSGRAAGEFFSCAGERLGYFQSLPRITGEKLFKERRSC